MESFVVSARKYRPLGFEEVVGQEHITTTLKNAIEHNKLAQAMLFCGPRGVGKTTCARIVARMINGFEEKAEVNSLNIFELDGASNNSVEDIRNLIDQVRYPPQFGKYKVYIIDEVHMLSNAAFNAFLKTLEEPPSYAIFILATTEKHKVIPTILSRCQIFDFNRIQVSDITRQLRKIADREGINAEEEALHLIAQKADGALRDGLSIFDLMVTFSSGHQLTFKDVINNLHILDYDYYFNVVDGLLTENPTQPLLLLDEVLRKGFDGHNFISGLSEHLRNLLVSQDARTVDLMEVPESIRKKYAAQAHATAPSLLLSWLNIANQCDLNYKGSKNQRLLVELALMKMAHVNAVFKGTDAEPEKGSSAEPAGIKKKTELGPDAVSFENPEPTPRLTILSLPISPPAEPTKAPPKENGRLKSTINLQNIFKGGQKQEAQVNEGTRVAATPDKPVVVEELKLAMEEFAESRKMQAAEYHLLKREFTFRNNLVTLQLSNSIEEPLLQSVRIQLTTHLRDKLQNSVISVAGVMQETVAKKMMYTNKEKFEHLAEKNPALNELKERLGLDMDF
jgi:DNA polymerase-3 subunit gamma/tau